MTRIQLATDLKTRTGAPDKDARIKNAYVETRGDQSVVRKRPIAQGGISVATVGSIAQGGIALPSGGVFVYYGDTQFPYAGDGTTWSASVNYIVGDHVTKSWKDYWALQDNIGNDPSISPGFWSPNPVPKPLHTYYVTGAGYDGGSAKIGPVCSTVENAANAWFALLTYTSCPGNPLAGYVWLEKPFDYNNPGFVRAHSWLAPGGNCGLAQDTGLVDTGTIIQVT